MQNTDLTHLHALELGLSHERDRLARETDPQARKLRQVWIAQREREIAAERKFLGLAAPDPHGEPDDDSLLSMLLE